MLLLQFLFLQRLEAKFSKLLTSPDERCLGKNGSVYYKCIIAKPLHLIYFFQYLYFAGKPSAASMGNSRGNGRATWLTVRIAPVPVIFPRVFVRRGVLVRKNSPRPLQKNICSEYLTNNIGEKGFSSNCSKIKGFHHIYRHFREKCFCFY